jgi:hypothetical protein
MAAMKRPERNTLIVSLNLARGVREAGTFLRLSPAFMAIQE